jgi:hypothetical protein
VRGIDQEDSQSKTDANDDHVQQVQLGNSDELAMMDHTTSSANQIKMRPTE